MVCVPFVLLVVVPSATLLVGYGIGRIRPPPAGRPYGEGEEATIVLGDYKGRGRNHQHARRL